MEHRIVELGAGDVDLVEGLWKEMLAHHHEVGEDDQPGRGADESWRMRRAQYVKWLESGEGMIFLVPGEGAEQAPLAYACLRVGSSGPTWDLGETVGDLESLSVAAAARGTGIGTELIEHCRERLTQLGSALVDRLRRRRQRAGRRAVRTRGLSPLRELHAGPDPIGAADLKELAP